MSAAPLITVHSLVGAGQVDVALKCFGSLLAAVPRPVRLALHDDGTLDLAARSRLAEGLGDACTFVDRLEASARVAELLRAHPRCQRFRDEQLFGPKLFDVPLLSSGRAVYLDSDILWTRRCDCPAYFAGAGAAAFVVMRDLQESYAVRMKRWPLLRRHGIRLASRFCAGMMSFDPGAHDLDYIEWLLGIDEREDLFGGFRFWAEQTIYAALAAQAGCAWIEPSECVVAHARHFARVRDAAVIHFAGFSRGLLDGRYREVNFARFADSPVKVLGTRAAPMCGLGRRMLSALRARTILRTSAAPVAALRAVAPAISPI